MSDIGSLFPEPTNPASSRAEIFLRYLGYFRGELEVLRQYVDFTGRARRKEYWMFTLISVIISLVLAIIDNLLTIG